ncbi:MAG: hypothetical protein V2I56_07785, partial [Desulfobacteraceae bacterium]|nr:hypothetical protein [Desulfobacteraceae bacterium]
MSVLSSEEIVDGVRLATLAYASSSGQLQSELNKIGWTAIDPISGTGDRYLYEAGFGEGFIAKKGKTLVISFTGSIPLLERETWEGIPVEVVADWVSTNIIDGILSNWEFRYNKYDPLVEAALALLDTHEFDRLVAVGHSMGGALVEKFMDEHGSDVRIAAVAVASPGIRSSEYFGDRIINIDHAQDGVVDATSLFGLPGADTLGRNLTIDRLGASTEFIDHGPLRYLDSLSDVLGFFSGASSDRLGSFSGSSFSPGSFSDEIVANIGLIRAIIGREISDDYRGTGENEAIFGREGNDTISGGAGLDLIDGGLGDDFLSGDIGTDSLVGGFGNDTLYGGVESDTLAGGADNDTLYGDGGGDNLYGGSGDDHLNGGAGDDILAGGDGNDDIRGGLGSDTAVYIGASTDYDIFRAGEYVYIQTPHEKDVLSQIEFISFSDGVLNVNSLPDIQANPLLVYEGLGFSFLDLADESEIPIGYGGFGTQPKDIIDIEIVELPFARYVYSSANGYIYVHTLTDSGDLVFSTAYNNLFDPLYGNYGTGYLESFEFGGSQYLLSASNGAFSIFSIDAFGNLQSIDVDVSYSSSFVPGRPADLDIWQSDQSTFWVVIDENRTFFVYELPESGMIRLTHEFAAVSQLPESGGSPYLFGNANTVEHASIGGRDFIYMSSRNDSAIAAFELFPDGAVGQVDIDYYSINSILPYGFTGESKLTHVNAGGNDFIILHSAGLSDLLVYRVDPDGTLSKVSHEQWAGFNFYSQIEVVYYENRAFVLMPDPDSAAVGGFGIYEMLSSGQLTKALSITTPGIDSKITKIRAELDGAVLNVAAGDSQTDSLMSFSVELSSLPNAQFASSASSDETFPGSQVADIYFASFADDTIFGQMGADRLFGGAGHDLINGGGDADTIDGGLGDDVLSGGAGRDLLLGDRDNDIL